jgi:hypothetical protein
MHENVHQGASEKHQERQVLEGMIRMAGQQVCDCRQHDRDDDRAQNSCSVDGPSTNGDFFNQPRPISACTHDQTLQKPQVTSCDQAAMPNLLEQHIEALARLNHPQLSGVRGGWLEQATG